LRQFLKKQNWQPRHCQAQNRHFVCRSATTFATAFAAEVAFVRFDFAAKRTLHVAFSGEAAANYLINSFGTVTIDAYCFGGTARWYLKSKIIYQLIYLPIG
jgi:hypothetical protein